MTSQIVGYLMPTDIILSAFSHSNM